MTMKPQSRFVVPAEWQSKAPRITVIGCGGTGSYVVSRLAMLSHAMKSLGHPQGLSVILVDGDEVSPFSVGRQNFVPDDVGRNKAQVLTERYSMAFGNAFASIRYTPRYLTDKKMLQWLVAESDVIVTCVDKAAVRAKIHAAYKDKYNDTLWLDTGNGAKTGQVVLGHLGKVAKTRLRLPNVGDLFPGIYDPVHDQGDTPSCSYDDSFTQSFGVNAWSAELAVQLIWSLMREGHITRHGGLFDMGDFSVSPLTIDARQWNGFGYCTVLRRNVM